MRRTLVPTIGSTAGESSSFNLLQRICILNKDYEIIEHTADVGIKIFGKTKQELFRNAALGMFFIITGSRKFFKQAKNKKYHSVRSEASSIEDLMVSWLNDLLYVHNIYHIILDDIIIKDFTEKFIQAEIGVVKIANYPYQMEREIKAVTYHNLHFFKNKKGQWEATVVFDI